MFNSENIGMFSQIPVPGIRTGHELIYGFSHISDAAAEDNDLRGHPPSFYRNYGTLDLN
jgi:hypothetical protein